MCDTLDLIKKYSIKQREAYEAAKKCGEAIAAIREVCEHNYIKDGHGHNYTVYKCSKCGNEVEQ